MRRILAVRGTCATGTAARRLHATSCVYRYAIAGKRDCMHRLASRALHGVPASYTGVSVGEFGGPEVLRVSSDLDGARLRPSSEQVVVALDFAGVNPLDVYIRTGTHTVKPPLPYTPGSDGAGVVVATGREVHHVREGDRVYVVRAVTGTYASHCLSDKGSVYALPDNVATREGAALGVPVTTAYRALVHKARAAPNEWVLVHGASGAVGLAAVQMAVAWGMKVIATAGTPHGEELVRQHGATHAVNHHSDTFEQVRGQLTAASPCVTATSCCVALALQDIVALTGGHGADVIVEMLGNVNLARDTRLVARNGRIVVVGSRGDVTISPRELMAREASVTGVMLYNATQGELDEAAASIYALLSSSALQARVGAEYRMSDAAAAHKHVIDPAAHGHGGASGKVVLRVAEQA